MIKAYAEEVRWIQHRLSAYPGNIRSAVDGPKSDDVYAQVDTLLDDVEQCCKNLELVATAHAADWARGWARDRESSQLIDALLELGRHFRHELEARHFVFITVDKVERFYKPGSNIFGTDVRAKFPKALIDIEDAGKALAFGLNTAAIFHMMRVMECGLHALSDLLGISLQPNWGQYIKSFNNAIKEQKKRRGISWKNDASFFDEVSGDLELIKSAWRNPTMHLERSYTAEEADLIFRSIKSFMQRLATRLSAR